MSFQMFERGQQTQKQGNYTASRQGDMDIFEGSRVPEFQVSMICSLQPLIFWPWQGFPVDWGFSPFGACPSWPNSYLAAPWSLWRGWLPPYVKVARWSEGARWRCRTYLTHLDGTWWNLDENIQCQFAFWVVLLIFVFFTLAHGLMIPLASIFSGLKPPNSFPNTVCVAVDNTGMLLEDSFQHKAEKIFSQSFGFYPIDTWIATGGWCDIPFVAVRCDIPEGVAAQRPSLPHRSLWATHDFLLSSPLSSAGF